MTKKIGSIRVMLLSEIFNLVFKKIHIAALVFFVTFLLVSQFELFEKKYLLKRNVSIGTHMGSSNFPDISVMLSILNSSQFHNNVKKNHSDSSLEVSAKLISSNKEGLHVIFKGKSSEDLIARSKAWLKSVNKIEEDLFKEKSYEIYEAKARGLNKKINFYKNYKTRFLSNQTLNEIALVNILNDKREVESWNQLYSSEIALESLLLTESFIPTKYFLDYKGESSYYFPNRVFFIGISLIPVVFYFLLILYLGFRKRS